MASKSIAALILVLSLISVTSPAFAGNSVPRCERLEARLALCAKSLVLGRTENLTCRKARKKSAKICGPQVCTAQYNPVCGQPAFTCERGAVCAAVMPQPVTYSNLCQMVVSGAALVDFGECRL